MSFKIDNYTSLLDQHLDGWVRNLKATQWLYVFLIPVIFIVGVFVLYQFGLRYDLSTEGTINTYGILFAVICGCFISLILYIFELFSRIHAKLILNKYANLLGSDFIYDDKETVLYLETNDESDIEDALLRPSDEFNQLQKKLGFVKVSDYCNKEDELTYKGQGYSCTMSEMSFCDIVGSGKNSRTVVNDHILFFTLILPKKDYFSEGCKQYFDGNIRKQLDSAVKKKNNSYLFRHWVLIIILYIVLFTPLSTLSLWSIYDENNMYIYLVPIIVISIVLFYLMYRHQKKLKNKYNQIKNDLYQSQTLPHVLNTLSQNVFKNTALFASDNNILYIAHQLDSNYLSAPIRWGIQKTKQKIREDLQLFFGVIEWMEQQK